MAGKPKTAELHPGPGFRIRHDIETKIRSGEWPPGFRIPVEHELTQAYLCSRATVSKAIGQLGKIGVAINVAEAGPPRRCPM